MKRDDKSGQFYLLATIIIITIFTSLAVISNYLKEKNDINLSNFDEELEIESERVLDYGIKNNKTLKVLLENFTRAYSNYSRAENLYYIFGNKGEITVSGYKKLNSGTILIDAGSGNQSLNLIKEVYNSISFLNPAESIKITIDGIGYDFTVKSGENFYFIISREINGEKYIIVK